MRGTRGLLVAIALVVLVGVGCSEAPGETSNGGGDSSATERDQAIDFAQCMRAHGVGAFPDPDGSGAFTIDQMANGSSLDPGSPAFEQALTACKDLEPAGFTGHTRNAEEQESALRFARCIRENGVTDFPDPADDEPLVDTNRIPSAAEEGGMDILDAAMQTCGDVVADLLAGR